MLFNKPLVVIVLLFMNCLSMAVGVETDLPKVLIIGDSISSVIDK